MRVFLILSISLLPMILLGQLKEKLSLIALLQPELTFHKNDYAHRWGDKYTRATFNLGISAAIQYQIGQRISIDAGVGYIPRRLRTTAFLNQSVIPPPRRSMTQELVSTRNISFRTMLFPFNVKYKFLNFRKISLSVNGGISGNYLMNTYYNVNFKKYEGRYEKNHWQGCSLNVGIGSNYQLDKKVSLFSRITFSVINTMKEDEYLFSQDQYVISLPHKYLSLSIGIESPLKAISFK